MSNQQITANVEKLAKKLEQNPNDAEGWLMLGRSYTSMERFADAGRCVRASHQTKWQRRGRLGGLRRGVRDG